MGSSRDLNGNVDGERPAWTMKELLMSLGIDPELLGYDEESEDWVKD